MSFYLTVYSGYYDLKLSKGLLKSVSEIITSGVEERQYTDSTSVEFATLTESLSR